jgi:hypothetical protein
MTRDPPPAYPHRQCRVTAFAFILVAQTWPLRDARALEPLGVTEPDVLREPAEVTRVVDAWEERGGIDLHFTLGYSHNWKRGTILRETQNPEVDARAAQGTVRVPVAHVSENTSRLNVRAELGLYHDLALILRVPIVLSSSLTLDSQNAASAALDGAPGVPLFALPFSSANRSGVEYVGVGVDWGILNQGRDGDSPSLLVGAEGRFMVSEPMHACGPVPVAEGETPSLRCRYPADINRNGIGGEFPVPVSGGTQSLEGDLPGAARRAGVSRGTTGIELHAAISRRFAYLEPYLTLAMLLELPTDDSDFGAGKAYGEHPPLQGRFGAGAELVPWELVEQYQRLSIDMRFIGTYRTRGQDYSELFDALGSSGASSYRRPNFAGYRANPDIDGRAGVPSVIDVGSERVFPTGLTEVEAHGSYALRLAVRWQAGQYVHFDAGGALALIQSHFITLGAPCDPSRSPAPESAGPCAVSGALGPTVLGAPNPRYRPETDQPGRRFLMDTASSIDAWVGATVMF